MFTKKDTNRCKGIAILMMLFHHLFNDYEEYAGYVVEYWPLTGDQTIHLGLLCKVCVTIFVFLSGYGIAAVYTAKFGKKEPDRQQLWKFTISRYWKLMAGYWFIFILALLFSWLGRTPEQAYGTDLKTAVVYFIIDFFGLSFAFHTPTLNPTWWYMSVALYIIFLMPFIMRLVKKTGSFLVLAAGLFLLQLLEIQSVASTYVFGLLLGVFCFENEIFTRWMRRFEKKKGSFFIKSMMLFLITVLLLKFRMNYNYYGIVDGLIAMTLCGFSMMVFSKIPLVNRGLEILGVHSANIFLIHNLLYSYYFLGFYYSFRYPAVILAVLTVTSLLISAAIERIKIWSRYEKVMKTAEKRICAVNFSNEAKNSEE